MTGALFKTELGDPNEQPADGRYRLTNHELARALGGILSTRAPGASALFTSKDGPPEHKAWSAPSGGYLANINAAAEDGTIQKADTISKLLMEYLGGIEPDRFDLLLENSLKEHQVRGEYWLATRVADFFREWLGYTDVKMVFKDQPGATSHWTYGAYASTSVYNKITLGYNNVLKGSYSNESTLQEHLDDTIARVVLEDNQVLKKLLTTRLWHAASNVTNTNDQSCSANANCTDKKYPNCTSIGLCGSNISTGSIEMHRVYNRTQNIPNTPGGRWIDLPKDERAGVLTHPAWLSAHGGNFEDDPSIVHRGKWIRENLLCEIVPPLELVMVEAQVGPSAVDKSARDRVMEATELGDKAGQCMWCHSKMNSLGYPFEIYNHAGFVRETDHGKAPNGSSSIDNAPDPSLNGPVKDAVEFSIKLSQSDHVKRCFVRQTFRFFMARDETLADACTLTSMESAYDQKGSFIDLLVALVSSDTFLYRHHEGE
ncbi:MAG TPA: DUF1588 domain-containing protein [Myxococcales bacterium]|nr:DUF1588 domain-containing protein [Myxococcales bacterium]